MKGVLRAIFALTIIVLLVTSAGPRSDAKARGIYDGEWSVIVYTLRGDCDRALRYSLRIVDNRVLAAEQSYQLSGAVAPGGEIRVTVAEGGRSASGFGRLAGNSGRGQWRTSTGECAGQWTAERRTW
jgi:hypothetical protein